MNRKERMKILERIAQSAGTTGTGTSGSSAPSANQPLPVPVQKSPAASSVFPSLGIGWDQSRVVYANNIVAMLDRAVAAGTNQKYNFKSLWDNRFPAGAASEFGPPVSDILGLFGMVFRQILNNASPFRQALTAGEMNQRLNAVLSDPRAAQLERSNVQGVTLEKFRDSLTKMLPISATR